MSRTHVLGEAFRTALRSRQPSTGAATDRAAGDDAALEAALVQAVATARAAYPGVQVDDAAFAAHLGAAIPDGAPLPETLGLLQVGDLLLAAGCARGEATALRLFEEQFLADVDGALAHINAVSTTTQEVKQILREQLLVGSAERRPKILEYSGRGGLRGWLRVVAVRTALMQLRKGKREVGGADDRLVAMPAPAYDPELEHIKAQYRNEFRDALLEAMAGLTDRERNVLRQHFIYGLTLEQVGALYQAHRATAARWIAAARRKLYSQTRKTLTRKLKLSPPELESALRLIQSRLDLSLRDVLG